MTMAVDAATAQVLSQIKDFKIANEVSPNLKFEIYNFGGPVDRRTTSRALSVALFAALARC